MSEIVIHSPDETAVAIAPIYEQATGALVNDKQTHGKAQELLAAIATTRKQVVELFSEPKSDANKAHKSICAAERKLLTPLDEARRMLSKKLDTYEAQQRRIADEARRKAEEAIRQEQEAAALRAAERAEAKGDTQAAEAEIEKAVEAPKPVVNVATETAKVAGVSVRTRNVPVVKNKMDIIRYVAAHPEWEHLLDINMKSARAIVTSMGDKVPINGLECQQETTRAVRAS